jgi:hypothetical protein
VNLLPGRERGRCRMRYDLLSTSILLSLIAFLAVVILAVSIYVSSNFLNAILFIAICEFILIIILELQGGKNEQKS